MPTQCHSGTTFNLRLLIIFIVIKKNIRIYMFLLYVYINIYITDISRNIEDENMVTMDFEEISDGELEEDIKTSGKGLGDALGVDWESLVKETQPRISASCNQNAENRWQCKAILHRIGVSAKYAGEDLMKKLTKKCGKDGTLLIIFCENYFNYIYFNEYLFTDHPEFFLHNVAFMHTALARNRLLHNLNNDVLPAMDDFLYR